MASPTPQHQNILLKLTTQTNRLVEEKQLGKIFFTPMDVFFDEEETYQPDLLFISKDRLNIIGEKKIEGASDLIVEILSPSTAYYDLRHKKEIYERFGVREYWILDPLRRSVEVYELRESKFILAQDLRGGKGKVTSQVLGGFELNIESIYR